MTVFEQHWQQQLSVRQHAGLLRERRVLESPQGTRIVLDGDSYLSFCSNDYLGLADDPRLKEAITTAVQDCGVGGGASHLISGHHAEHEALEQELAAFTGRERALVFSSGYMANLAVIAALACDKDVVFEDKLNHASLIDGGQLSGARFQRYLHNDSASLARHMERIDASGKHPQARQLVVTDGVFSMDGDVADLAALAQVCQQRDALLVVDDAHGLGVIGHQGLGTLSHCTVSSEQVPVLVGTFGKAFGTAGAFIAGSTLLIDYLTQFARPYVYTTAMPPMLAAATRVALQIIQEGDDKRLHLQRLIRHFGEGLDSLGIERLPSITPIQPIVVGSTDKLIALQHFLNNQGLAIGGIRPPTVPANTSRLRVTLSAAHQDQDVERLLECLAQARRKGLV